MSREAKSRIGGVAGPAWFSVRDVDDILRGVAEIGEDGADVDPMVDADCAKLARQLRHSARMTVGLLPTNERAHMNAFATELAFAISLLTEKTTVVFDPEQASGAPNGEGTLFYGHVPARLVVTLVPFARAPAGAKFEVVKLMGQLVDQDRAAFGHVLVDLTGCRLQGELLGAIELLDGIIVVGPAGEATESDLLDMVKLVPPHLSLGVVLTVGDRPRALGFSPDGSSGRRATHA